MCFGPEEIHSLAYEYVYKLDVNMPLKWTETGREQLACTFLVELIGIKHKN